jgi:hypothetical protein
MVNLPSAPRQRLSAPAALALLSCAVLNLTPRLSPAETTSNLLINGDAETGTLAGWARVGPGAASIDNGAFNFPLLYPADGFYDFVGGSSASSSGLIQIDSISTYQIPYPLIDAGLVTLSISYLEQSLNQNPADTAAVSVTVFDASSTAITTAFVSGTFIGSWGAKSSTFPPTPGVRSFEYQMTFTRNSGADIDSYLDDNSVTASYAGSAWKGTGSDHLWNNPSNWNTGIPASGTAAVLTRSSGSDFISLNTSYASALSYLYLDSPGGMTLNQSANTMAATNQYIAYAGTATYNQTGGANTANLLEIAHASTAVGAYFFSGGTLTATICNVGLGGGKGNLFISGGVVNLYDVSIGGSSTITLSAGTLNVANVSTSSTTHFLWTDGALSYSGAIYPDDKFFSRFLDLTNHQSLTITGSSTFSVSGLSGNNAALVLGLTTPGVNAVPFFAQEGNSSVNIGTPASPRNVDVLAFSLDNAPFYKLYSAGASLTVNGNMYFGGSDVASDGYGNTFQIDNGAATITGTLKFWNGSFLSLGYLGGSLAAGAIDFEPSTTFYWFGGTLTLLGGYISGLPSINVPATGTLAGSGSIVANITLNGNITVSHLADDLSIHGTVSGPGNISVAPFTSFTADSLLVNSLTVGGLVRIRPNANNAGTLKLNVLTLAGTPGNWTGKLDLTSNALIVQSTAATKSATLATLTSQIAFAAAASWSGNGLTSATAALDPAHKTVVLIDNALLNLTTFAGQPVDNNSLLIEATWFGDSNLDRKVDVTDLGTLATNYGKTVPNGILQGDFNNDGKVDVTDLGLLATNYGQGTSGSSFSILNFEPLTSSPEPATVLPLTFAAIAFLRRRNSSRASRERF